MRLLNSIKSTNQQARVRSKLTERELGESSDTVFENDRSSSVSRLFLLHHFTTVTLDTVEIFFSASKRKEQVLEVRQQEQSILERREREREREGGRERRGWA